MFEYWNEKSKIEYLSEFTQHCWIKKEPQTQNLKSKVLFMKSVLKVLTHQRLGTKPCQFSNSAKFQVFFILRVGQELFCEHHLGRNLMTFREGRWDWEIQSGKENRPGHVGRLSKAYKCVAYMQNSRLPVTHLKSINPGK